MVTCVVILKTECWKLLKYLRLLLKLIIFFPNDDCHLFSVDVYLVGCTNVGKSTLFNALLNSDLCKVQAKDLVQRATTSLWPGTTLNLLKFPILNPSHHRIYLRNMRLREMKKVEAEQEKIRNEKLKKINSVETATLKGYIGQTFGKKVMVNESKYLMCIFQVCGEYILSNRLIT